MKKKIIIFILIIVAVCGITATIIMLSKEKKYVEYVKFESRIENVETSRIAASTTYGWLQVQGTNIDYPVVEETQLVFSSGIDYIWRSNRYDVGENREMISGHNIKNITIILKYYHQ